MSPARAAVAPAVVLDPLVRDLAGETARLCADGPFVRIDLLGAPAWTVTRHSVARRLLTDPRLVKDIGAWGLWQSGAVTREWPLIAMVDPGRSMFTEDGEEHRRLRAKTAQAITPRRLDALRPVVERLTEQLLADVADVARTAQQRGEGARVDLKTAFAQPLPMGVVCTLMGVPEDTIPHQMQLWKRFFSLATSQEERLAAHRELWDLFRALVREKTERPTDDLTSALIFAEDGGARLTEDEVVGNLTAMIGAGHETTVGLILNAVRGLLAHPDQLALVLAGEVSWEAVVEETLRWDPPVTHLLMRFATEDVEVDGFVIEKGESLVVSYRAIGRDAERHGADADAFDVTREGANRHMTFGHGPHICPGAALSRLEATVALPAIFARFPGLRLAVPTDELRNLPVLTQNDLESFPVLLHA